MPKIRLKEYILKDSIGYMEKRIVAYADVTNHIKDMMDGVEKAYYVVDDNYDPKDYGETEAEGKKRMQESVKSDKTCIQVDGCSLYVKFKSGKTICFHTSEWGDLRASNMEMFEN